MARTERDVAAGRKRQAPAGRKAPSARDGRWMAYGEEGSAVPGPGTATVGGEPAAPLQSLDEAEAIDAVLLEDADEQREIADAASAQGVLLIDHARLTRELGSNGFLDDPDEKAGATSQEDEQRRCYLRRYAHAPGGLFRRHLVADANAIQLLDALAAEAPNAARVIEMVKRAALLSRHAG